MFNITYTYRRDSVIPSPYGKFILRGSSRNDNSLLQDSSVPKWKPKPKYLPTSIINRDFSYKSKDILWIVSHCKTDSKREDYVKQLQNELSTLSIDILGQCGQDKLPTQDRIKEESLGTFTMAAFKYNLITL